jgi:hypothetical protein
MPICTKCRIKQLFDAVRRNFSKGNKRNQSNKHLRIKAGKGGALGRLPRNGSMIGCRGRKYLYGGAA